MTIMAAFWKGCKFAGLAQPIQYAPFVICPYKCALHAVHSFLSGAYVAQAKAVLVQWHFCSPGNPNAQRYSLCKKGYKGPAKPVRGPGKAIFMALVTQMHSAPAVRFPMTEFPSFVFQVPGYQRRKVNH